MTRDHVIPVTTTVARDCPKISWVICAVAVSRAFVFWKVAAIEALFRCTVVAFEYAMLNSYLKAWDRTIKVAR